MMGKQIPLEICCGDPEGIEAAVKGGADRVELCSGLSEGGLTPSVGVIKYSCKRIPTNVLIRPRAGDFVYSQGELEVMKEDIRIAFANGASGVVIGVLTPEGDVDKEACQMLLEGYEDKDNTFHRAFDLTADPYRALEDIISLGFKRILTSGQAASALEGAGLLAELKRIAKGRIKIMAGAGVAPSNAVEIIRLSEADEIHASARSLKASAMNYQGAASMGTADATDGSRMATDPRKVTGIREALNNLSDLRGIY